MKIVWICSFSNAEIREKLEIKSSPLEPLFMRAVHRKYETGIDTGIWVTNGIHEMESIPGVELHVVTPARDLAISRQDFTIRGVNYHFLRDENSGLYKKVKRYLFTRNLAEFKKNRKNICSVIQEVQPDVVHVIGAENPFYSLALLDIPKNIPTILQLQALLVSLGDKVSGELAVNFAYKGNLEKQLIQRADYVGTCVASYIEFIRKQIKPDAVIVNTTLPMSQKINLSETKKEYTFVHFAGGLSTTKATDVAVEAFILAHEKHPEITLDIIGGYSDEFRSQLDKRLEETRTKDSVTLEGKLPTHDDVLSQIRKAKFALLPLKTDIVPNTLHESMANGLPLLTTKTPGTPKLNEKRESVMISEIGDYQDIAKNMQRLLEEPGLAEELRSNAAKTEYEYENNRDIVKHWVEVYGAVLSQVKDGQTIPEQYLSK